jgi:hypothetical protein
MGDDLMKVHKVTEPDRTLNIMLNREDILSLLYRGNLLISRDIPREEGFNVQFINIRLEDFKKK